MKIKHILLGLGAIAVTLTGVSLVSADTTITFWKLLSNKLQPNLAAWTIYSTSDFQFDGDLLPDGADCSNGQILKKTGANDWDCAADATGGGITSNSLDFDEFVNSMTLDANLSIASAGYNTTWNGNFYHMQGKVGIGTTAPSSRLDVKAVSGDASIVKFYSTTGTLLGRFENSATSGRLDLFGATSGGADRGAFLTTYDSTDPNNSGYALFGITNGSDPESGFTDEVFIQSTAVGTGTLRPINFYSGFTKTLGINTNGSVSASFNFEVAGNASASATYGSGLSDCDADNQTIAWDVSTGKFSCGDDDNSGISGIKTEESGTQNLAAATILNFDNGKFTLTASGTTESFINLDWGSGGPASLSEAETITGNWLNTANPWDISTETNLTAGTDLTLTNDDLSLDSTLTQAFTFSNTGSQTFSGSIEVLKGLHALNRFTATGSSSFYGGVNGSGLVDCDTATTSKLLYDITSGKFSCGTDTDTDTVDGTNSNIAFITIGNTASLSLERALAGTANQITLTDGGANGAATLSIPSLFSITAASLSSNLEVGGYASASAFRGSAFGGDCDSAGSQLLWDTTTGRFTCETLADADIPDTITVSNYLLLAGGTLTGNLFGTNASFTGNFELTTGKLGINAGEVINTNLEVGGTSSISGQAYFGRSASVSSNLYVGNYLIMPEISTPATPPANHLRLYTKDDGTGLPGLFYLDDAGTETQLGGGGGGGCSDLNCLSDVTINNVDYSTGLVLRGNGTEFVNSRLSLTTDLLGFTSVASGGTGFSSYTAGDLLYATGATTLSKLAIGTAGRFLQASVSNTLVWEDALNLQSDQTISSGIKTFASFPRKSGSLTPTVGSEFGTKEYIDTVALGLEMKGSSRVATTVAGTLATSFENGDTIDGIVLATGDRILIKDQADATTNGIYTVNASGAPTRATDYDATSEVQEGTATYIVLGTANGNEIWAQTTVDPTLGASNLVFTQVSAPTVYTASLGVELSGSNFQSDLLSTGAITLTGNEIGVSTDGSTIEISSNRLIVKDLGITNDKIANASLDLTTKVTGTLPVSNGGTNLTAALDDNLMVGNGTTWQSKALADCDDTGGQHLNFDTGTNAFSCGTSGGSGSSTGGAIASVSMDLVFMGHTGTGTRTWTNMPNAATELFGAADTQIKFNATYATKYRILARNRSATLGADLNLQCSATDGGAYAAADTGAAGEVALNSTAALTRVTGGYASLVAGCKGDMFWRIVGKQGNGVADPIFSQVMVEFITPAGGAPLNTAFVTIGNDGNLSAERALTGTANQITLTDGGANGAATLSVPSLFAITAASLSSDFEVDGVVTIAADTVTSIPGSNCVSEGGTGGWAIAYSAGTVVVSHTANPSAGVISCTIPVPQKLHGRAATLRSGTFYFTNVSVSNYITTNLLSEYNPSDATTTAIDNDTTDITSGTSHAHSSLPYTLATNESDSSITLRISLQFDAAGTITIRGATFNWDTD